MIEYVSSCARVLFFLLLALGRICLPPSLIRISLSHSLRLAFTRFHLRGHELLAIQHRIQGTRCSSTAMHNGDN